MKKVWSFIICVVYIFCFSIGINWGPVSAKSSFDENNVLETNNLDVIWKYLKNHKKRIGLFASRYEITENSEYQLLSKRMDIILNALDRLKKQNYQHKKIKEIKIKIIKEIKDINKQLKSLFISEKKAFDINLSKKKKLYWELGFKLSLQLNSIIKDSAYKIKDSKISVEKKKRIYQHLKELQKDSRQLRNIKNISFKNEQEIKSSIIRILQSIKYEIRSINAIKNQ